MNGTRIRSLVILSLTLSIGVVVATQVTAARLPERALGWNLHIGSHRLYPPWSLLRWHDRWGRSRPDVFRSAEAILAAHGAGGALLVAVLKNVSPSVRPIGKGHWATLRDIKRAGLVAKDGVVVARHGRRVLIFDGPEHQLTVGATRSGKGVSQVIPTLLSWLDSAVVHDVKGELWKITAGWRSRFSHCLYFDPTSTDSAHYNPLTEVRKGVNQIRDVQNISEMLVNPDGAKEQFDVWDLHSKQLLTAVMLHVLHTEPDSGKHLGRVRERVLDLKNTLKDMIELPHLCDPATGKLESHPEIARVAKELLRQAPKFVAGVAATAQSYLTLFADELIVRNTSASDFTVGDLMCAEHPVTLYIQPPPSDIPRLRPLTRLLLNQISRALLEQLDHDNRGRPKRRRLLFELDEFVSLGRLEFLSTSLRQMAGYGIKAHIIVQSFNDLIERYGLHQSIIDNCHVISVFACADTVTAQRVSQMCGESVEYRDSYGHRRWPHIGPDSVHQGEQVRPLVQPGEVRCLSGDQQLVFVTGHKPMRLQKIRYYTDPVFKHRVLLPPDQAVRIDSPHGDDLHPELGVPHDLLGERPKGERIPSEVIFDHSQLDDEEWMLPGMHGAHESDSPNPSPDTPTSPTGDDYAL